MFTFYNMFYWFEDIYVWVKNNGPIYKSPNSLCKGLSSTYKYRIFKTDY